MLEADWTIMVFLNADNNLEPFGITDYREMAQVGSSEKVNIVVQFDRNGGYATTSPQWKGGYRFKVEKGVAPRPDTAVETLGDTNMGSGITLRNFVDWAASNYPAKRYMLDIWNHGQGWRFFRTVPPAVSGLELNEFRNFRVGQIAREAERRSRGLGRMASRTTGQPYAAGSTVAASLEVPAIPANLTVPGTVRYVSSDDTSNDFLYNREMQDSLAGLDLDLIGFDACLMAMIETAYALRKVGKVMVGSEELEPGAGWNYSDWLAVLTANPEMTAHDLGKALVESYRKTYSGVDEATTLSAVDLKKIGDVRSAVDGLADAMTALTPNEFQSVLTARAACGTYAPGYGLHGIDLAHFASQVRGAGAPGTGPVAAAVEEAVDAAVVANHAGEDRRDSFGSRWLGVYFPARKALFQADPDRDGYFKTNTNYPVEFVQDSRWADFLVDRYLPQT
jgi:hypothetical protein